MATGDLYRSEFRFNVANHPASFVLGFEELSSTLPTEQELCSLISAEVNQPMAELRLVMAEDVTLEGCVTRAVTGNPKPPGRAWLQSVRGEVSGQSIPAIKSLMVKHKQTEGNANRNGKSYVGGIPEARCEGNICINQATIDAVLAAFDALTNISATIPDGTATFKHVVLSRPAANPQSIVGLTVTGNSIRNILYNSARRRTREYGFAREVVNP